MDLIENFKNMSQEAFKIEVPKIDVSSLAIVGMGGSAITGDILRDVLDIRVDVFRGYHVPGWFDGDLAIFISYSGNTEETISAYTSYNGKKIVITSGGKLEEMALKDGVHVTKIPTGLPPRFALPYLLYTTLNIVSSNVESGCIEESVGIIDRVNKEKISNISEDIDGIITIYCTPGLSGAARRLKTQINENSKLHARWEELPELNHNEIMGWENDKNRSSVIFLKTGSEIDRIQKRLEFTENLVKEKANVFEIMSVGDSSLAKIVSLIYQGDLLSVMLAQKNNIDPVPVESISKLKEFLSKN